MFNNRNVTGLCLLALATAVGLNFPGIQSLAAPQVETVLLGQAQLDGVAQSLPSQPSKMTPARTRWVKVFLPRSPGQENDMSYVEPIWRQTTNSGLAQFAIEQVIAGPTQPEKRLGFMAPINLRGTSNCGKDFTLSIKSGVAKLQFCKAVASAGIGDDARAISSLNSTLKQFPGVRSVVILNQEGDCLGDMSNENHCLRQ